MNSIFIGISLLLASITMTSQASIEKNSEGNKPDVLSQSASGVRIITGVDMVARNLNFENVNPKSSTCDSTKCWDEYFSK